MVVRPARALGRAADDLLAAVDGVDLADAQPVGVGVLHGLDDARDREGREPGAGILDVLDLQPGHGHGLGRLRHRGGGLQVIPEPGQGELHACCLRHRELVLAGEDSARSAQEGASTGRRRGPLRRAAPPLGHLPREDELAVEETVEGEAGDISPRPAGHDV
jgi:hypothetical protein